MLPVRFWALNVHEIWSASRAANSAAEAAAPALSSLLLSNEIQEASIGLGGDARSSRSI